MNMTVGFLKGMCSDLKSVCLIYCYFYLKSTVNCPPPINYTVPNITNAVSYTASNLYPYTKYMVKVVAINGEGEGHPVNTTVTTEEEGTIYRTSLLTQHLPPNSPNLEFVHIFFFCSKKRCRFSFAVMSLLFKINLNITTI